MSENLLHELARIAGVATAWTDVTGTPQAVAPDVLHTVLDALGFRTANEVEIVQSIERLVVSPLTDGLPPLIIADAGVPIRLWGAGGRYRIDLEGGTIIDGVASDGGDGYLELPGVGEIGYHALSFNGHETVLAVAPPRCFGIKDIDASPSPRLWGLAAPVYALRRKGDGGIGDFGGLSEHLVAAAAQGADAYAINPVHALFAAAPDRFSPYAPSNRAQLNPLHADARMIADLDFVARITEEFAAEFDELEALDLIDWPRASRVKLRFLRKLFDAFNEGGGQAKDFNAFRKHGARALEDHARFEAIQAVLLPRDPLNDNWRNWPVGLRDPHGRAVADFAAAHADDVSFYIFLQWLADRSLVAAQKAGRDAGMKIGLITDLAVGATADGSYAWSRQSEMLSSLSIGAPPDIFNMHGQSWGIAPFSPYALRGSGYHAFLEALRATMKHAGGIRIDHAMGLARLWVLAENTSPKEGTYLDYPAADLFRLIALESWRNRTIVIGEDLGTVPPGFRETLRENGILGTEVMWFERDASGFFSPHIYSLRAMATTTTHDLPTVAGWWRGSDIADREGAGVLDADNAAREVEARERDRAALWRTFVACDAAGEPCPGWTDSDAVADAASIFVAKTPSPLVILPLVDALALPEQANMPGTVDEFPNWRRRLPGTAEEVFKNPRLRERLAALARNRPARKP